MATKVNLLQRISRAILGVNNDKPGKSPFCEQVIADNKGEHQQIRKYISDVDTRAAGAVDTLRTDMCSRLDTIVKILKPD